MDIVVVGGGYAGVMAADRLARKAPRSVRITLIDPNPSFTERIRLHRVAAGLRDSASVPWDEVLHPRVDRLPVLVDRIDVGASRVSLRDGGSLPFDHLVYAVGSGARNTSLLSVTDRESTREAAERIASLEPGSRLDVEIVGAGDAVRVSGAAARHHRASCAAALPMGRHAADAVLARIGGGGGRPLRLRYVLQCLDLADGEGHVQFVTAKDAPRRWDLSGRPGGWVKEGISRSTVAWLRRAARA